jgi:DNA-binding transcriptional MerR regulator
MAQRDKPAQAQRSVRRRASSNRRGSGALISRSAFCVLSGVSERELALWEHEALLAPAEVLTFDNRPEPLYAPEALERAKLIRTLAEELEVNLPGIDIILSLLDRMR